MSVKITRSDSIASIWSSILSLTLSMILKCGTDPSRLTALSMMLPALIPSASKWLASRMVSSEAFSLIREAFSDACLWRRASLSPSLLERGCNRLVLPFLGDSPYASVIAG